MQGCGNENFPARESGDSPMHNRQHATVKKITDDKKNPKNNLACRWVIHRDWQRLQAGNLGGGQYIPRRVHVEDMMDVNADHDDEQKPSQAEKPIKRREKIDGFL